MGRLQRGVLIDPEALFQATYSMILWSWTNLWNYTQGDEWFLNTPGFGPINWSSSEDRFLHQPHTYGIRTFEAGIWGAARDPSDRHPGWRIMATGESEKDV